MRSDAGVIRLIDFQKRIFFFFFGCRKKIDDDENEIFMIMIIMMMICELIFDGFNFEVINYYIYTYIVLIRLVVVVLNGGIVVMRLFSYCCC